MRQETVETGRPMTYAEFASLPEQPGLQLIDGMLVREPAPGTGHQEFVKRLFRKLDAFVEEHGLGTVYFAPLDVVLAANQSFQPDILFVAKGRLHIIADHAVLGAPDLVVEVLSPSTRDFDLGRKREVYFEKGVRELWIADMGEAMLLQHARGERDWQITRLGRQDTIRSYVLPGFVVSLTELFPTRG